MKPSKKILFALLFFLSTTTWSHGLDETYINEWKKFYPSKSLSKGIHASIFQFEDFSSQNIEKWLGFNQQFLSALSKSDADINAIDARLLRIQVLSEIDQWKKLSLQQSSLQLYTTRIAGAIDPVLKADYLLIPEKFDLVCQRLQQVTKLSQAAQNNLNRVAEDDLTTGITNLSATLAFYQNDLQQTLKSEFSNFNCQGFNLKLQNAIKSLDELHTLATGKLSTNALKPKKIIGYDEYARRLKLYTDSELTPEELAKMALEEIEIVRGLIGEVAKTYLKATYPNEPIPDNYNALTAKALGDMEKDAPLNAEDYLQFWHQLSKAAVDFIEKNEIATLPKNNTLRIITAPESAGPAARIGWVASAPPFDPNPITTLNLPSIPETLPKQEQIDFWASFNKPFNRMIVIHELFPGHYMQLKISRETAHPTRLLFPYGTYIEGWATFTEKVLLDAGWEKENHLTYLAHLRKRLENANRAYTSMQVHCNGWSQEQVMEFSTETSLLAPQFAKSLWGRIMNSPMQLTSYFLGGSQFRKLWHAEQKRLGNKFELKLFMDTIMKAGPIPIDEFYEIFALTAPN
ncbi:DUF885 family protein [Marinicella sp. S1101]|uniref:DUF885 family protein n=1 Tax=Marinicella marina TaxID=2996016 RepID=UPI002260E948|nr:DUF885 family protein [Marinicella marina]MCX7553893.1 DUF885 family protein [Marinicella marina]MDJ1140385.1 DUF885 family protein [Marinicella marina]